MKPDEHPSRRPESEASRSRRRKQVRLTVFDNEPMARLAEQRLQQEGIPCYTRSLRGGPGLWGSAYNLPHALYVNESDEMRAREVLDLPPQELAERNSQDGTHRSRWGLWLVLAAIIVIVLALLISISGARVLAVDTPFKGTLESQTVDTALPR